MTLAATLFTLGLLAVPAGRRAAGRRAVPLVVAAAGLLLLAVVVDAAAVLDPRPLADVVVRIGPLDLAGADPVRRALLLGALAWCGPAADVVVRAVLEATGLPAPERAAEAGFRAGRWVGRLERWTLLVVVAAGQPALAVIPAGGKALLRYAEAVADARAGRAARRVERVDEQDPPRPTRDALLDYVLVGSLASWAQALVLGLLVAA